MLTGKETRGEAVEAQDQEQEQEEQESELKTQRHKKDSSSHVEVSEVSEHTADFVKTDTNGKDVIDSNGKDDL